MLQKTQFSEIISEKSFKSKKSRSIPETATKDSQVADVENGENTLELEDGRDG